MRRCHPRAPQGAGCLHAKGKCHPTGNIPLFAGASLQSLESQCLHGHLHQQEGEKGGEWERGRGREKEKGERAMHKQRPGLLTQTGGVDLHSIHAALRERGCDVEGRSLVGVCDNKPEGACRQTSAASVALFVRYAQQGDGIGRANRLARALAFRRTQIWIETCLSKVRVIIIVDADHYPRPANKLLE